MSVHGNALHLAERADVDEFPRLAFHSNLNLTQTLALTSSQNPRVNKHWKKSTATL